MKAVYEFLPCKTPDVWVQAAIVNQELLLIDHAHCEKKAASAAMNLIYQYSQHNDLIQKMSRIVREEMRHFEQVLGLMHKRNISFTMLPPGRYGKELHKHARHDFKNRLVDLLIIGAYIEARSCERFAILLPYLDLELQQFYHNLLAAEARHFEVYLKFARNYADEKLDYRIKQFGAIEEKLILEEDPLFRFHSGSPI